MKDKILKSLFIIGLITIITLILTTVSNAANLSISTSKSSVSPGESFNVTVTLNGGAGPVNATVSNGSGSGSQFLDNSSLSFTCTAGSSGTVTISASGTVGDYATETDVNVSNSKTVTIVVPEAPKPNNNTSSNNNTSTPKPVEKKSSDSKLKALTVEGYQILPEFSADVKEYTLNVPYEVNKLNVSATVNHSKATYSVSGEEELEVGENDVIVTVKAEDGSTTKYKIKVTRAREELYLSSIIAKITDENGVITELPLNPIFSFDVLEYTIEQVAHTVGKIEIEAIANLEGATVEIVGNENLQEGENTITITTRIPKENVDEGEEVKVYTIKINKEAAPVIVPPTMIGQIKDFFNDNNEKIIYGTLLGCAMAFVGLTIYFIVDYKKYKVLIKKVAELNKLNNQEVVQEINVEIKEEPKEVKTEKKVGRHF